MNLLIVEDDKATIQSYSDNIDSFNKKSNIQISHEIVDTLEKAKESLISPDYDAAIVDLKLSSNTTDLEGLEIVNEIESTLRFPIFVVSGSIGQVDKDESAFFKKRSRDGDFKEVLQEILDIYNTGITKILGKRGVINKYLTTIFWNHLSNSMTSWVSDEERNPTEKEKSLLRYTLLHMQEFIDEDIEEYHPEEFYITEPIKSNIFTGDIVQFKEERFLILTPSCDIVLRADGTRNTDRILFCRIKNLSEVVKNFDLLEKGTSEKNDNRRRLNSYIENKKQNYHFIPKSNIINAGLIDFQDKLTMEETEVNKLVTSSEMTRLATISMPFLKDIISRYSNYYARQGSPDFDTKEIYDSLF